LTAHNRQPRLLSAARRATVRLLVTSIAALLAAREEASRDHATTERTLQISRAASDILARDLEAAPALQAFAAALVTTTGAGGAVIRVAGIEVGAGSLPDRATVERILQVARGRMDTGRAAIESLAEADPALAPHGASASGLVAMALPGGDGDILALLRGEISEEIVWATAPGNRPTDAGLPWVPAIFRRESGPVGADEPRVERTRGVARGWPDEVGPLLDVAREAVFDICRVTGERAAHAALRARETELRAIYESVDEGLAHVDALGRVVAANRRFAALVGIDPEDVAGRRFDTLVEITEPSTGGAVLAVGRAKGKPRAEAARDRPIEIRVTAVGDGDGARAVVIRDIAQREQFERELVAAREAAERASRAKDEFLANMSHELRTPLTAVLGYIDLLDQQLRDPVQRKWIATIRRSGWSLLRLLSDLVDFARMDADDIRLEYAVFDPVGKANSLLDLYRPTMDEKGIRGEVRVAAGVPRAVVGDPARARQILGNLVGNAVKFTREGTITIDIDARPTDREGQMELEFAIADTGIGIAPEKLPELFERFSQIDAGITRQFGGVGLGLAIARGLARRMGGDIVAESQGVGRGAVFRLRLPVRTAARATGPAAVAAPAVPGQRGAILIIEDDPVNQELLAEMTRILGFAPEVAGNGEIGVERAAARGDLAAILVDVSLPGMDGKEATRRIRRLSGPSARLPIVCVTALASDRDRSEALEAGADAYLTKPVRLAELRSVLEQATGGKVATGA
ncbi:MAG: ATP-binding protein, partial [Alphaproteobacteria bacterium]